ncbi:T7SS effector LXG polymorphic toxin [uncultured Vagococcus sp.]|uniref:T7SS effector LXG polymorphic toxin n=1 Tax=uncultured Vagococcus sp. TaxID=189676 RepID=UPI0028D41C78|nr:T7SS effector LXG polymorphic toxin [uncultured Vagococcus sp.]
MSVDMYVSSSQSQASSVAAICRQQKQGYEQLQRAINDFVVGSPQLQGAAYDSAKQFFNAVLMPLSKGGILLSEAVMEACQKFPEEYMASVDSGDLKESDLREKIDQLNRQMSELSDLHDRLQSMLYRQQQEGALDGSIASRMSGAHSLMATYGRAKQKLQEKLDKLLDFNGRSPDIFSEIDGLKQDVETGTGVANVSWNSSLGTFTMPKSDKMGWATAIADSWLIRENKAKGIDPAKVEELKDYDIYAKVIYDVDGNPKVFWQLMKDGKGIKNKELYRYLKKAGEYLDPNMFEFISLKEWDKMVKEGFKNGINIENGDEYKGAIKGIVGTSQVVESVYTWTTESELAQALQILGFTYASYRIASSTSIPKNTGAENPMTGKDWNNYFKEKYGAENVKWKNPASIDEIIDTPSILYDFHPKDVAEVMKDAGWTVGPLKKGGSAGVSFENGGGFSMNPPADVSGSSRYIQYHPGGGHHGELPYYKVSSPKNGTKRIYMNGMVVKE